MSQDAVRSAEEGLLAQAAQYRTPTRATASRRVSRPKPLYTPTEYRLTRRPAGYMGTWGHGSTRTKIARHRNNISKAFSWNAGAGTFALALALFFMSANVANPIMNLLFVGTSTFLAHKVHRSNRLRNRIARGVLIGLMVFGWIAVGAALTHLF